VLIVHGGDSYGGGWATVSGTTFSCQVHVGSRSPKLPPNMGASHGSGKPGSLEVLIPQQSSLQPSIGNQYAVPGAQGLSKEFLVDLCPRVSGGHRGWWGR